MSRAEAESALRLAAAMGRFWDMTGSWTEGRDRLRTAIELAGEEHEALRAAALTREAVLAHWQGDSGAEQLAEQALKVAEALGDSKRVAHALHVMGLVNSELGRLAAAREFYDRALKLRTRIGDRQGMAVTTMNTAIVSATEGDLSEARSLHGRAYSLYAELGDKRMMARSLLSLAAIDDLEGRYADCRARLEESFRLASELGDKMFVAASLDRLAELAQVEGNLALAEQLGEDCLEIARELGATHVIAAALASLGLVTLDRGDHVAARALAEQALAVAQGADEVAQLYPLNALFSIALEDGRLDDADSLMDECRRISATIQLDWVAALYEGLRGIVALEKGQLDEAEHMLGSSMAALEAGSALARKAPKALRRAWARLALARGDTQLARARFVDHINERSRLNARPAIAGAFEGLAGVEVADGRHDRAAVLLGAAEAIRAALDIPIPRMTRAETEAAAEAAREGLGGEGFSQAHARGIAMDLHTALSFALEAGSPANEHE